MVDGRWLQFPDFRIFELQNFPDAQEFVNS